MISALAAHFVESGLPANTVIAVQMPNTIEFALTVLAGPSPDYVAQIQALLSDPRSEPIPTLDRKSALGAFDRWQTEGR